MADLCLCVVRVGSTKYVTNVHLYGAYENDFSAQSFDIFLTDTTTVPTGTCAFARLVSWLSIGSGHE
jgi:hypothetical protein